jgi:predicted cupin superfamily sugar epimerase
VNDEARAIIDALNLAPHPEGGFYRETFRAPCTVTVPQGRRAASTAIYFLLPAGAFSALHRVRSDEAWHHYAGDPVDLHTIDDTGVHAVAVLGSALALGERPQIVVPSGVWQAAVPRGTRFALCGCTVAPGFDFADFEIPTRAQLTSLYPGLREVVEGLTQR